MVVLTAIRILTHDHGLPIGATTANKPTTRNWSSRHKSAANNRSTTQGLGRAWQPAEGTNALRPGGAAFNLHCKRAAKATATLASAHPNRCPNCCPNCCPKCFARNFRAPLSQFEQQGNISGNMSGALRRAFRTTFREENRARSG